MVFRTRIRIKFPSSAKELFFNQLFCRAQNLRSKSKIKSEGFRSTDGAISLTQAVYKIDTLSKIDRIYQKSLENY